MKTIAIIPARGGSVRIPGKNIKLFHGKPIICYSIETARASMLFDDIIVSTDDLDIAKVARGNGATVHWRKPDDGTRGTQEVAAEVLSAKPAGLACVLYATAPLLTALDVCHGWQRFLKSERFFIYSVDESGADIGGFYWGLGYGFGTLPLRHHADDVNIPASRCCDINTPEDFQRAEEMYAAIHG